MKIPEIFRWLRLRMRGLLHSPSHEKGLDGEMRHHLEMLVAEKIAEGMTPHDARLAARREFGAIDHYREACRDTWRPALFSGLSGDLRFAIRSLRRSPTFTVVAMLTLGVGIGVNTTMFSIVRDVILRPLSRDHDLNLVTAYNQRAEGARDFRMFSYPEFEAVRDSQDVFVDAAASTFSTEAVGRPNQLQRRLVNLVSENYFSLLDIQPFEGRFFTAEETAPGASIPVAVANHGFWERLGQPRGFVGSTIRVNQRDYTVVGITPPGFVGLHVSIGPDVWLPLGETEQLFGHDLRDHGTQQLGVITRLRPELTLDAVTPRLAAVNQRLNDATPDGENGARQLVLAPPSRGDFGNAGPSDESFLTMFGALAMALAITVLVVACFNLANMLLARGASRHKEIAVRISLGASRWQVVRQLTAEGFVLSLLGAGCGLILSLISNDLLMRVSLESFSYSPFVLSIKPFIDAPTVAASLVFCLLTTVVSSLGPAIRTTRLNVVDDLKLQPGTSAGNGGWGRFFSVGNNLVMIQIALSLALLFSAALFVQGAWNARSEGLGFDPEHQVVVNLDYRMSDLTPAEIARRQHALLTQAAGISNVESVSLSTVVPYNFELSFRPIFHIDGVAAASAEEDLRPEVWAGLTSVTRGYFEGLGIDLLQGRDFSPEESNGTTPHGVVIVDESLANSLFGDNDPVGRSIFADNQSARSGDHARALEIIGVVRSPRNQVFGDNAPRRIYRPLGQAPGSNTYLHFKTHDPASLITALRDQIHAMEPATPVLFVRPLSSFVEKNINVLLVKLGGGIFGGFGAIALLLAVVGIYGVKTHAVTRRTREIGIRIALGARPGEVIGLILRQGALQTAIGVCSGILLALTAGRILAGMLYRVSPSDLPALLASALILSLSVLLACWIPARRATKVDPVIALRAE